LRYPQWRGRRAPAIADDYLARYAAAFPQAGAELDLPGTDHD